MLLSIIRQNQKLAAKRNPAFDRNRFAKFLIYFMVAFWAAYLIFIGVMLSFAFEDIFPSINGSLKFEITAKRLYAASQRVL